MPLHPNEIKVLSVVSKEKINAKKISEISGIGFDTIARTIDWLKTKNLLNVEVKTEHEISLNDEGKIYLTKGLPERQIINALHGDDYVENLNLDKNKGIEGIDEKIINIALGWLKRKQMADFKKTDKGIFIKILNTRETPDEILLKKIGNITVIEENLSDDEKKSLSMLKQRKILDIKEKKEIFVSLTDNGEEVKKTLSNQTEEISQISVEMLTSKSWKNKNFRKYDINVYVTPDYPAKIHPLRRLINEIKEIFIGMGFTEVNGTLIESAFWNFDCLFQPQDHPARDMQDTFYLKNFQGDIEKYDELKEKIKKIHETGGNGSCGWGGIWKEEEAKKFLLRTHTTAVSAHILSRLTKKDLPTKVFTIGKVFRNEAIDFKHLPEFYQVEGIIVDENANFRNLLSVLEDFYSAMKFKKIRFRPGYFPYTEMSIEPEIYLEEKKQWMELGGAGIFRPEVVAPLLGFECPVLAWGLGLDRIVALKLGLNDIRDMYISNIEWLKKS